MTAPTRTKFKHSGRSQTAPTAMLNSHEARGHSLGAFPFLSASRSQTLVSRAAFPAHSPCTLYPVETANRLWEAEAAMVPRGS